MVDVVERRVQCDGNNRDLRNTKTVEGRLCQIGV